jgi:hypothetical protein
LDIRNQMASTLLAHGTIVQLSKSNAASKTSAGQWAVCILDKDSAQPGLEGTFNVFSNKEEAEAYLAEHDDWLLNIDGPNPVAFPSPDQTDGFIASLTRKKADLHHLSSNWSEWCATTPSPPLDSLIGRHVQIPIKIGTYHAQVIALIASKDVAADTFRLTYDSNGSEAEIIMMAAALKEWCRRRPDALQKDKAPAAGPSGATAASPAAGYPLPFNPTMCPLVYGAIKKLTVSSNTPGNTLDAREALAVLAARHGDRSEYAKLSLTSPGTDADDAVGGPIDIIVDGLLALESELGKPALNNPAQPRLWPADSAKKLGEAIASAVVRSASILPPQHPLATALKAKAVSLQEWLMFLADSWMITADQARQTFAQSKRNDDYIMSGMLEHFLRRSGATIATIAAYDDNQDASSLLLLISYMGDPSKSPPTSSPSPTPSQFQPAHFQSQPLTSFQQQLGLGAQQGVQVTLSDKKAGDTARDVLQLRADAQALLQDPLATAQLENLVKIKDSGDGKLLDDEVKALTCPKLKRLIASDGDDLSKHLHGTLSPIAMHIDSIRRKLEDRMQAAVTGGATASLTNRQKLAIRHARLGHLQRLHIFHLIDEDDCGTKDAPLAQLGKWSTDKQKASLALAMRRLETILQFSNPSMIAEILTFFTRLLTRLLSLIDSEVKHTDLSKWYAHIIEQVTKPLVKFSNGDTNSGALEFDVTLLGQARDAEEAIRIAEATALAASSIGLARSNSSSSNKPGGKGGKAPKDDDAEKDAKKPKLAAGHPLKDTWADKDEDLQKVQGKYVKRIRGDHPLMLKWIQDTPKKDGKNVCWMHFNLQGGCVFGKECKNSHAK